MIRLQTLPGQRSLTFLVTLAILAGGLLASVERTTRNRIEVNRTAATMQILDELLRDQGYDNQPHSDVIQLRNIPDLGITEPLPVYRARLGGQPAAAVITAVAPDGYVGSIRLLISIAIDGRILGARVVQHSETPGLGDGIETGKSLWIHGFTGHSAREPAATGWSVRRDGGEFDQLTGATITSRAVVTAIYNALLYFEAHREELFTSPPGPPAEH